MASVSDKPWSDFSQADYNIDQWRRACLVGPTTPTQNKGDYKLPIREPDGTLNRNAVHAAAGRVHQLQDASKMAAARKIISAYNTLGEEPPDDLKAMAGQSASRSREVFDRVYPLENIEIISRSKGGDGRTVEAYAAVFDTPTEIRDQYGHYSETIHRSAFNRTVSNGGARRAVCLYNHGYNPVTGKSDVVGTVPLGSPLDVRVESRGLLTVTRYNKSSLAEATLEAIKNGDIQGQSFRGPVYDSNPRRVPRYSGSGPLPVVTRMELGLRDYGPTPIPAYDIPMVTAVRSAEALAEELATLDEETRQELIRYLAGTPSGSPTDDPTLADARLGAEDPQDGLHSRRQKIRLRANRIAMDMALSTIGVKGQ